MSCWGVWKEALGRYRRGEELDSAQSSGSDERTDSEGVRDATLSVRRRWRRCIASAAVVGAAMLATALLLRGNLRRRAMGTMFSTDLASTRSVVSLADTGKPTRLLTFNVWWLNEHFTDLASMIGTKIGADIANLQEAPHDHADKIVDALNALGDGSTWALASPWDADYFWCGQTVYRSDIWKVIWTKNVQVIQDGNAPRGVCGALLQRRADGVRYCVWGAHPVWEKGGSSAAARSAIRHAASSMEECSAKGAASIFMCDCNTHDASAVEAQLERSTGWKWSTAVNYGYDQVYIQVSPDNVGRSSGEKVVEPNAGDSGCQESCSNEAWAYSDHPPVHVDVDPADQDGATPTASPTQVSGSVSCHHSFCDVPCFPGEAMVHVRGRGPVPMVSLRAGDQLLVERSRRGQQGLDYEAVLGFLHVQRGPRQGASGQWGFLTVVHARGEFRVSANHIVFLTKAGGRRDVLAASLRPGDLVLAAADGGLAASAVLAIRRDITDKGMFAPLTAAGTLVVDGVLASCYAAPAFDLGLPHAVAHVIFSPLRALSVLGIGWLAGFPELSGPRSRGSATGDIAAWRPNALPASDVGKGETLFFVDILCHVLGLDQLLAFLS